MRKGKWTVICAVYVKFPFYWLKSDDGQYARFPIHKWEEFNG